MANRIYNLASKYTFPDNWVARFGEVGKWTRGYRVVKFTVAPVYCGQRHWRVIGFAYVVPMRKALNRQWRENRLRRLEAIARGLAARLTR